VTSREPEHLSIGEVLAELSDEFPDITISKIRFLESQGLVNPERTPSGYRKFYADDLTRLRWILFQQKEHFLPLKVIKERLDELPPGGEDLLFETVDAPGGEGAEVVAVDLPAEVAPEAAEASAPAPAAAIPPAAPAPVRAASPTRTTRPPRRAPAFAPTLPADDGDDAMVGVPDGDGRYTRAELAAAAGVDDAQVAQLESFGLVTPAREVDGLAEYDDDALEIVRITAGFFSRGVEGRHLRMYRNFADREAVLFGQVLLPYVRQRNPEARARLQEELGELASLGRQLRTALLREAVRETLAE
jgi:DNA-binding transcriptional MerR regulator